MGCLNIFHSSIFIDHLTSPLAVDRWFSSLIFHLPRVVVPYVVGNACQPSQEARGATVLGNVGVGFKEGVLSQVIAQGFVACRLDEEEPANRRLVFTHQLVERPPVVKHSHLCR